MAESACVSVSPLDNVMAHCYLKLIFGLSVPPDQDIKQVHRNLQQGLSESVARMPIFSSTVGWQPSHREGWKPGQLEVRVPKEDSTVEMHFNDLTAEMDFADLMDAGFPEEALHGEVLLPHGFGVDLGSDLDVMVTQANFVKGGCIIGLGIWHSVADAYGAYNFIKDWSENCKRLQDQMPQDQAVTVSTSGLDRGLLTKAWRADNPDVVETVDGPDASWRLLGLNSPRTVNPLEAKGLHSTKTEAPPALVTSIFYVSKNAFSKLKRAATPPAAASKEEKIQISANDAINALAWRAIMTARFPDGQKDSQTSFLDMAMDGRAQFSSELSSSYLGNVVFFGTASLTLSTLVAPSTKISHVAQTIREALNAITSRQMQASFAIASAIPDYTKLSYPYATFEGAELSVSSTLNIPMFELDFGSAFGNNGHFESIRILNDELDTIFRRCAIFPMRKNGGFEILITLFKEEMDRLVANREFTQYAKFSCH